MLNKRLLAALAAAGLTVAGCGGGGTSGGDSRFDLVQSGTLTVCSDVPYAPFEMEGDSGYTGFDIELMREIAAGLGLEFQVKDVGFSGIQSGATLASRTCDVGASAMSITEPRKKNLDFSKSYYDADQSLLVPVDSPITGIDDLAGKRVGVQGATTGQEYAKANAPQSAKIVAYPSDAELYAALKAGQINAILQDLPVNQQHVRQEGSSVKLVGQFKTEDHYGFAVAEEGRQKLLEAINKQLRKLKENGTYEKLYDKYFTVQGGGATESS